MVKVFLCDSVGKCHNRLQECLQNSNSCYILVPNKTFQKQLLQFQPEIQKIFVLNPSDFIREIYGLTPLSDELAAILDQKIYHIDAACLDTKDSYGLTDEELLNWQRWLLSKNIYTILSLSKNLQLTRPINRLIFLGEFPHKIVNHLQTILSSYCRDIIHIKRVFNDTIISKPDSKIKSISVKNYVSEYLWAINRIKAFSNANIIALHNSSIIPIFQNQPIPFELATWLDWQEKATSGYFLVYLRTKIKDNTAFEIYQKDLKDAQEKCLTEDYPTLYRFIISEHKNWIKSFICLEQLPKAPFYIWLTQLQKVAPSDNIFDSIVTAFDLCPLNFEKTAFFKILRCIFFTKSAPENNILHWEDVAYFQQKNPCFILDGIKTEFQHDQKVISWLQELAQDNPHIEICAPTLDDQNNPLDPLFPTASKEHYNVNCQGNTKPRANELVLPTSKIKFSCKNWERFYLCPRNTWLKTILKTNPTNLNSNNLKTKIIGEWVHENLQFKFMPKSIDAWQKNILTTSEQRWTHFQKYAPLPITIKQWHQRALAISIRMLNGVSDFLKKHWEIYSEWALPDNSDFKGRIDLLAIDPVKKEAVVVDFKSSLHYIFNAGQINRGHALQLLLYGQQIQKLFKRVSLRIIRRNGQAESLTLSDIQTNVEKILNWIEAFQLHGNYQSLPEEDLEGLPLCYSKK